ncbi:1,3-beta-D-glucan synthase, partial [Allomyces arbusculus]
FIGGYFYLVRPFSGVLESWWKAAGKCPVDEIMCGPVTYGGMALLVALQTVLYFLDTYLWYMVVLALVSVGLNMVDGISALSMWRETFYKLPNRIVSKLIAVDGGVPLRMKQASSEIWNSIVLAMYKEHLLPAESLPKMLYQIHPNAADQDCVIEPRFFLAHEDSKSKGEFFPTDSEVERRLSYFSQSLCMNVPEPTPVARMPTFSVLIPHYSEKILLSLEDCTEREDKSSRITLLEYLKTLYPDEWDNFVAESKIMEHEQALSDSLGDSLPIPGGAGFDGHSSDRMSTASSPSVRPHGGLPRSSWCPQQEKAAVHDNGTDEQNDDLLAEGDDDDEEARETAEEKMFRAVGYTNPSPSFVLRTRIWTSLRSQTLYRTVSGFMNYNKAIQIRHRAENLHYLFQGVCSEEEIEDEADYVSSRKFRLVVAMQRYQHFDKNDLESVELLFSVFADLAVSYIEEVPSAVEGEPPTYYSCLIDGWCNMTASGARQPRFRIRLPGNPILGDGKGDNQNSAIVFTRGEVLQLIDANQDSYLEESLKVANVLSEFELPGDSVHSPYSPRYNHGRAPVAIVGTREHIFSERVGSLADVAAGKEFAFGTLIQRAMTRLGSRLQYGHPDLLNSLYMITRGGVSKAQKGLHLNEDIYAGMNVLSRGGRIKHSEYLQCGKGRDLGFTSVLNFTAKLGSGAGEQVLSRDVWYLGTRLPLDRLLSYYFAHIGFYINAAFVVASVVLFLWTSAMAAVMQARHPGKCTGKDAASTCPTDLATLQDWVSLCVSELIFSLLISFLPLLLQMVNEYGVGRALKRILMQFFSLVSLFEGFAIYVYSSMFWHNLALGGAGYIATGRAVSTARAPFSTLYQRFSRQGIALGVALGMLALLVSTQGFQAALVFYWIFVISYALSPFLFNPNQFVLADFLLDYRVTLRWLFAGHQAPAPRNLSWANLVVADRGRLTGERGGATRARLRVFIVRNLLADLVVIAFAVGLYGYAHPKFSILDSIIRVAVWPAAMLGVCFAMSAVSLALSLFLGQIPFVARLVPAIGYGFPTLALIAIAWVAWALEGFALPGTLVVLFPFAAVLHAIETLVLFFVPPEFDTKGTAHRAFWTGRWHTLGAFAPVYVVRELLVVPFELAWFALDWATIHVLVAALFPVCLVPFVSDVHTLMLLWVRKPEKSDNGAPANGSGGAVADATAKPKHRRRRLRIAGAALMLAGTLLVLAALVVVPAIVPGPLAKIVAGIAGHLPLHALKAIPVAP